MYMPRRGLLDALNVMSNCKDCKDDTSAYHGGMLIKRINPSFGVEGKHKICIWVGQFKKISMLRSITLCHTYFTVDYTMLRYVTLILMLITLSYTHLNIDYPMLR